MLKKASLFLLFVLLIGFTAQAQYIKWQEDKSTSFLRLHLKTHTIERYKPTTGWVKLDTIKAVNVDYGDILPAAEGIHEFQINQSSTYYLTIHCTGQVYQLDKSTWSLKRLDQTFFRGANCKSSVFMRGDDIYSFGGYGFWKSTNLITKYDFVAKEWLSIAADGDVPASIFDGMAGYSPKKDRFYLLSTVDMNDTEKKTAFNRDYGIYEYDFFNQKFTRLGEIKLEIVLNFLDSKETKPFVFNGRYFIISDKPNKEFAYDTMFFIDLEDNFKVYQWKNPHRIYLNAQRGDDTEAYMHVSGDSLVWSNNLVKASMDEPGHTVVSIKTLLNEAEYIGTLDEGSWVEDFSILLMVLGAGLVVGLVFEIFRRVRRNKLKKSIRFMLGANERLFLDFLILNYEQGFVNGHQIIAFFGKHKSSPESQRQFRAKLIENFTKMLGLIFVDQEILDIQLDEQDQRMFTYRLQPEAYKKLKGL
ncbi:hypothetical protein SKC37_10970 [Aquirufa sp. HETE-83D]|uniref:Uncharacterized protein n=1 Tax=Aquirufa esocilacus TaxID=3096513 RepID=A0ABW6DKE7_9BACT